MSDWKDYVLEDVIDKFIDYRGKTPKKTTSGIPLVTAKIVKNGRLLEPNEYIAEEDYESWMTRGYPEINDVILTSEAPLGEVALIKNKRIALAQRIITLQTKKNICDSVFLKYYFQSNEGQASLQSRASGSTVEGIKAAELKKLEISLPPLHEQTAIASILSSLDDKLDLLHRQNTILEKMAETLFRQWFVEEAKEEWEEVELGQLIEINGGFSYKGEYIGTGEALLLGMGCVSFQERFLTNGARPYSGTCPEKYLVDPGDLVIATRQQ
jgi:type I restriction enzyme, S subunit